MIKGKNPKKRKAFMRDSDQESQHSGFQLDVNQKKLIKYEGKKKGHWDETQKTRYFLFIDANKRIFSSQKLRRADLVFSSMSQLIETRSCYQCKTHHQKMVKKYGSYQGILEALKEDNSTRISYGIPVDYRLNQCEFLSDFEDIPELPQVFSTNNEDIFEQQQYRSVIQIEKSIKIEDIPFFESHSDNPPSPTPQLFRSLDYSASCNSEGNITFQ